MTSANWNAPREQGSWNLPGATPAYPPGDAPAAVRRGRPGLATLVVVLVELVIIAAAGNQSVAKHALRYATGHQSFLGRVVGSSLTFTWRLTPLDGDNHDGFHLYASQFVTIGVFLALSALLTVVVTRGLVGFGRVFVGVWTAVLAASCVACAVGALVTKQRRPDVDRATFAVFDAVNGDTVFAGAVIGLVAALIAAAVAQATRRTVDQPVAAATPPEQGYVPEAPPPFYGAPARDPRPRDPRAEYDPRADNDTAALPSVPASGGGAHSTQQLPDVAPGGSAETDRTTQVPRFDPRGGQQWTPPEPGGESTQALPNAPDDGGR